MTYEQFEQRARNALLALRQYHSGRSEWVRHLAKLQDEAYQLGKEEALHDVRRALGLDAHS